MKAYIENLLTEDADNMPDEELYKYLAKTKPDGNVYLTDKEQNEFENWLKQ